jgi:enoyl-CoA hydratase
MPIHYETVEDHIVLITIDRPERKNALDLPHWRDLANSWKRFRDDDDARVAIITGVKDCFCAGADLKGFINKAIEAANGQPIDINNMEHMEIDGIPFTVTMEGTLRTLPIYKPIVAAVGGPCVAGGIEMVCGTDIVVASSDAVFGVTEAKRGLFPGGGTTPRLPRQVPWRAAMELLLTADMISAERALRLGLINDVVPKDQLLERALQFARSMAANGPIAMRAIKESSLRALWAGSQQEAYEIESECVQPVAASADAMEGPLAFAQKRAPVWTGR